MRRTTRRALAAAVLLTGALAAASGATAAPARVGRVPAVDDASAYALAQAVEDLAGAAAAAYPRTYGGTHRDPVTGVVTLSFTRDAAAATAGLLDGFPDPGLVRTRTVARSLRELDAVLARITADVPALRARGDFTYAYVDVPANAVAVAFASGARYAALLSAYGPAVRVEQGDPMDALQEVPDACPSRELCAPYLRGGAEMRSAADPRVDGAICTSGFPARKDGRPAMITAGHCFRFGSTVMLGGALLGAVTASRFSGAVDGQVVEAQEPWQPTNWLYWTPADTRHQVKSVARTEVVGNPVCRVGRTTARTVPVCGPIVATNVTITYPASGGRMLTNMRMARACGIPGDSGGPILYGSRAYGVLSGGNHRTNADGTYSCNPRPYLAWSRLTTLQTALGATVQLS